MPRARHIAWFTYGIICIAVLLFPPWIISDKRDFPKSFSKEWFISYDFHFWSYEPVQHSPVHGHPAYWGMITTELSKQVNYGVFGVEIILLSVSGLISYRIIRWYDKSLSKKPAQPAIASFLTQIKENKQATVSKGYNSRINFRLPSCRGCAPTIDQHRCQPRSSIARKSMV